MATYNAADWVPTLGVTGAAIQAAYDAAVVDQSTGGERGATLYVPRIPGKKAWVLTQPLRIGPGHGVNLHGDGQASADSDWGGTLLDATAVTAGPAILLAGGVGLELRDFAIRFGAIGLHFDADSTKSISGRRMDVRNLSLISTQEAAVGVQIEGHGRFDSWDGVRLNADQVGDGSSFYDMHIEARNGTAFRVASKQAVNVKLIGGTIGGRIGLEVVCGGVHVYQVGFGSFSGGCVHVRQHGQPKHYSDLHMTETYHELRAPGACFEGLKTNNRPTRLTGCRFYMQGGTSKWIDAAGFDHLLARDCVFEAEPGSFGTNTVGRGSAITRPTYIQW